MAMEAQGESEKRHLNRLYRNRNETDATKQLGPDVEVVILETKVGAHRVEANLRQLFPEGAFPEPCMGLAAAAFGLNTVLGNAVAGRDKGNPIEVAETIQARWDSILEGEWSEGRQGPATRTILEAWRNARAAQGLETTDEKVAEVKARFASGEFTPKQLLDLPAVQVAYQELQMRKQAERLAQAKAKAAAATTQGGGLDL